LILIRHDNVVVDWFGLETRLG